MSSCKISKREIFADASTGDVHVVLRVPVSPGLRRYPVKTSTWVTRCSGSAHRSGGSPEAFIVLQVYCDRPGSGRPHRRPIRLPRGRPPHFPSRLFAWLPSHPRNVCLGPCTHANLRKWKSLKSITTLFRESISTIRLKIIFCKKKRKFTYKLY